MAKAGIPPTMGGDGENSYFRNSTFQRQIYESIQEILKKAVQENFDISLGDNNVIRIADLGCSVGPNTFYAVESIIDAMCSAPSISELATTVPEFQVFFNDQMDNDFNMLFNSLPLMNRQCFVAGVPGSFHSRLFPRASIHFFNSSISLHWLSKAPKMVGNRGQINYYGADPSVQAAYMVQFKADMGAFLESRAKELVEGGLLSLLFCCRRANKDLNQSVDQFFAHTLEPIFKELILEGKMKEEELDAFQMPIFSPTIEEFKEVVQMNGHFTIHVGQMIDQELRLEGGDSTDAYSEAYLQQISESASSATKSIVGELLKNHFGVKILEEVFKRFPQQVLQYYCNLGCRPASPPYGFFILQLKLGYSFQHKPFFS